MLHLGKVKWVGKQLGAFAVVEFTGRRSHTSPIYKVSCSCGEEFEIAQRHLDFNTISCRSCGITSAETSKLSELYREWEVIYSCPTSNRTAHNRATKEQRVPPWGQAERDQIAELYARRPEGYHVDHIAPLNGELISGLHCLANLQYLPAKENCGKRNLFTPYVEIKATGEKIYIN